MFKKMETMFNISMFLSVVLAILGIVMIANPSTTSPTKKETSAATIKT